MVRLASIEFTKLKNVRAGTRLTFPESGAVLLGKNGTGKTTLLQYIVALCTVDANAFSSEEPFDVSAAFSFETGASATLRIQGTPSPTSTTPLDASPNVTRYLRTGERIKIDYLMHSSDKTISYRISIIEGRAELYRNEKLLCEPFAIPDNGYQFIACLFRLSHLIVSHDNSPTIASLASLEFIELKDALCRFDEGLDYFKILTDEKSSYLSLAIVIPKDREGPSRQITGPYKRFPDDLFKTLDILNQNTDSSLEFLSANHSTVGFLREFVKYSEFSGATAIIPIEAIRPSGDGTLFEWKRLRFSFEIGKEKISHERLSFGQKRLLSYLYYLACNHHIGIADELVNGLHHEWIEHCLVTACENRQMFYTSQNPLLLDFLEFRSDAEVSERFITCKWNEQDGFVWENLDPRIGQEFYRLYKAGLQHVSDILRTKGWW